MAAPRTRVTFLVATSWLASGCGSSDPALPDAPFRDAGPLLSDASPRDALVGDRDARDGEGEGDGHADAPPSCAGSDLDTDALAAEVTAATAVAQQQGDTNCAAWLPDVAATDAAEARTAVAALVARLYAVGPADVSHNALPCGVGAVDCAHEFQHALFKADGRLGTSLLPVAVKVDANACDVADASWTPSAGGAAIGLVVTIAGVRRGRLVGIYWVSNRRDCSVP